MKWIAFALLLGAASVASAEPDGGVATDPLIAARPFEAVVPAGYAAGTPVPLVVLLHGYGASATLQDAYFHLSALAQQRGFLLALPDGTVNVRGQRFWNATDACCGFGAAVDDVAYLAAVIHDMQARFTVDPKRIFLVGHSNGGFMSHRMACDHSELIAGIVSLAGATWSEVAKCNPGAPVSVLQVHGTLDAVIKYGGGALRRATHAGAEKTVALWGAKDRCASAELRSTGADLDLVSDLPGAETQREALEGCPGGAAVELWRIRGGPHLPRFKPSWAGRMYDWLLAHPKP